MLQDDYTSIKGWATSHVFAALAIGVALGLVLGALLL